MRPVRLELKNFTAYRGTEVLDFRDLDLFAITGPTGSGKSSLLDAITYALYGKAPRVGKGVKDLIALGQPRLAVLFEFEVEGQRFRVARETPRDGGSSIRLERQIDGEWASAGEGADRINEANAMIEKLIGLDYVGFTRSIVLPQGQFAEFLSGDPKDRRRILTELMDLGLFQRMAARSGEIAREARASAQAKEEVLARQYAGVDEAAVREARARARQAKARSAAMASIERTLDGLARDSESLERRIQTLEELRGEALDTAASAEAAAADLDRALARMGPARGAVAAAEQAAASAEERGALAAASVAEAEASWGPVESLATLRGGLEQLAAVESRIASEEGSHALARQALEAAAARSEQTVGAATEAAAAMEQAGRDLSEAEAEHERAHRADMVGALTRGAKVGDPCPVCRRALDELPRVDARRLARVATAFERAKESATKAGALLSAAQRESDLAQQGVLAVRADLARIERGLESLRSERSDWILRLETAFGGPLPARPLEEVEDRLQELRARRQRAEEAETAARAARATAVEVREASRGAELEAVGAVAALRGLPIPGLITRARRSLPGLEVAGTLVGPLPEDPEAAMEAARGLAGGVSDLVGQLAAAQQEARAGLEAILDTARALLPDGVPKALLADLDDLLDAAHTLAKDLVAEAAETKSDAARLAARMKERKELEAEARTRGAEAAIFHALATELRADRLITFLQGEALELLAAAGSDRLLFLSQGRYRLVFEADEFWVEDRQNGDERRPVKTLSGGETFLASLALALALSEQIQSLAATHRSRLQSLFIDEGFGALDQESLEVATEALSHLGGQDRMIGVITHVAELADRLPVRIEVRKGPGGSRLEHAS